MQVGVHDAETGKAQIIRQRPREGRLGAECEEIGGVDDLPCLPGLDHRNMNRLLEELAGVKQPHRERLALKERAVRTINYLDMLLEIDAIEQRLGPWRLRHIRGRSAFFCFGRQEVEIERHRIAQPHAGKRCCRKPRFAPQASDKRNGQGQGCSAAGECDGHGVDREG